MSERFTAKAYWSKEASTREHEIINTVQEAGEGDTDATNHLPVVLGQEDFEYRTGNVRNVLGLDDQKQDSCSPEYCALFFSPT